MGGTVTIKQLAIDHSIEAAIEKNRLEMENQLLRNQVEVLHKFIAQKWFVATEKVQDYVEDYMTKAEFESVKVIQGRLETHDWILDHLNNFELKMMDDFEHAMNVYNYGRSDNEEERKAEVV